MKRIASLEVDPQNTFTPNCPNELPVPQGHLIVDELNAQADKAMLRIVSKDSHTPSAKWLTQDAAETGAPLDLPNADMKWPSHAMVGTYGWELIDGLPKVEEYDLVIYKGLEPDLHPYGACFHTYDRKVSTGIIEYLIENNIETVVVGGLAMEFCVLTTLLELEASNEFDVVLNLAATRALSPEGYEHVINEIATLNSEGCHIRTINDASEL
jgi:nicotinamidase/pyrazinamidase